MKKYDRETKKYVEQGELEPRRKARPKDVCRGGKVHHFILMLPYMVTYNEAYRFNPEEYYKLKDAEYEYVEEQKKKIRALGIVERSGWNRQQSRHYICSVCKKEEFNLGKDDPK